MNYLLIGTQQVFDGICNTCNSMTGSHLQYDIVHQCGSLSLKTLFNTIPFPFLCGHMPVAVRICLTYSLQLLITPLLSRASDLKVIQYSLC